MSSPHAAATITGLTTAGGTLAAARSGAWPTKTTLSYVWVQDAADVSHQTVGIASTLPVTGAMVGHTLTVLVTATPDLGDPLTVSSNTVTITQGALVQTPTPVITGTPAVGSKLTAAAGTWDSGVSLAYAWLQDPGTGAEQVVGTAKTLSLTSDMSGHSIKLQVTGSKAGYPDVTTTSDAVNVAAGALTPARVAITGTPAVSVRVTAALSGWKVPAGTTYTYSWTADAGTPSAREVGTATNLVPTPDLVGSTLTVTVTASATGFASASATSAPLTVVNGTLASTPIPVISGTPAVDSPLTAVVGAWTGATATGGSTTLTFAWILDAGTPGATTVGATKNYTPTADQQGHTLTFEVVGSRPGYNTVTRDSSPVLIL